MTILKKDNTEFIITFADSRLSVELRIAGKLLSNNEAEPRDVDILRNALIDSGFEETII